LVGWLLAWLIDWLLACLIAWLVERLRECEGPTSFNPPGPIHQAHSAAVDQLGGLYTWGQGSFGRCGHGVGTDMPSPARVESLSGLSMSQAQGLWDFELATIIGRVLALNSYNL